LNFFLDEAEKDVGKFDYVTISSRNKSSYIDKISEMLSKFDNSHQTGIKEKKIEEELIYENTDDT
jgi:hypothetical protein